MITGDGGWRRIDQKITDRLRAAGIPIVGFIASDYYRTRRTPDESACALERIIRYYKIQWHQQQSDADRLLARRRRAAVHGQPPPARSSRRPPQLIALLGLEPTIDFKYSPAWSLAAYTHKEPQYRGQAGDGETARTERPLHLRREGEGLALPRLDRRAFKIVAEPGGHHFAGKYRDIADVILIESAADNYFAAGRSELKMSSAAHHRPFDFLPHHHVLAVVLRSAGRLPSA